VSINATKNEENEVRDESEAKQYKMPNYFELPNFKILENERLKRTKLWEELNMDALEVMACFSYLVSTGQICLRNGKRK
jgi:hypothetical protein